MKAYVLVMFILQVIGVLISFGKASNGRTEIISRSPFHHIITGIFTAGLAIWAGIVLWS